ncbi:MAG: hypothetical protein ABR554_15410 [Pyrinomonadaceae bacterium]
MSHGGGLVLRGGRVLALARPAFLALALAAACASTRAAVRADNGGGANMSDAAPRWLVVQLRSFVPGAAGRVVVEPNASGGVVRLRATRLPAPSTVTPGARAFVVWATGGEVRRLGELRRDARGNASIEFSHPAGFASYSLLVTAEEGAQPEHPAGAFVFSTRAGEVSPLYPVRREEARTTTTTTTPPPRAAAVRERTVTGTPRESPAPKPTPATPAVKLAPPVRSVASARPPATPRAPSPVTAASAAEFYESINSAVEDPSAARTLTLAGEGRARRGGGEARVATRAGTAYVRVRFRRVPPPARYGVRKYVMWAETQDEGTLFLRALPATRLNRRTVYARRPNFPSNDFQLAVTAERSYPRPRPRGRRVLTTVNR